MPAYTNPVLPGFYPDPSVCRVGADFYLVTSSFEYFPGVPVFHSRDLVHFRQLGHCLTRPSQLPLERAPASSGIFAPTIRHHRGRFYMTTTNVSSFGNFIVSADAPEGPWSEPMPIAQPGIDPSLFFDDDGTVIFTTSHGGALQSRIDIVTGQLLSEPKLVWTGTGGQYPEGPHLYKRQGFYYLLLSEGGTEYGHMLTIARSPDPFGPFEPCPRNPLLSHRSLRSPIQGVGHADLVEALDGSWFAVCLGFRPHGYPPCYHLGRETFLCPVSWHADGFPILGEHGRLPERGTTPLDAWPLADAPPRDDFDTPRLAVVFEQLRNPVPGRVTLLERPGFLRLWGGPENLDDTAAPAWVGQRQRQFSADATVCLEFDPAVESDEAGLTVRMNERHHYEVFVTRRDGATSVVVRRRIGSLRAEVARRSVPPGTPRLILRISAVRDTYTMLWGSSEDRLEALAEGETRYLSTEVAGGFTGVYFAVYATGNGTACQHPADFDWFEVLATELPSTS